MPNALLPRKEDGSPWYSEDALSVFRLSSKGHWDVPIRIEGRDLHFLVSHPTPPAFDGPEDRNGKRNHDEIRIWADYLAGGERSRYLAKSIGVERLDPPSEFVVLGDLNADPIDGAGSNQAIRQLLDHPAVDSSGIPRSEGGPEAAGEQGGANREHRGDPAFDTADFDESVGNLRVDYVLPSKGLRVVRTGIFWPRRSAPDARLVAMKPVATSDHRLVWIDLEWPKK
jgi:3-phytase